MIYEAYRRSDMNSTSNKTSLDLFLLLLKAMFHQEIHTQNDLEESDAPTRSMIKSRRNEIPNNRTDNELRNLLEPMQVTNAYKMLNHFMKDKTKLTGVKAEDEIDLYGRLLAIRLRQLPHIRRQEVMYEIDGIFLDHCRNLETTPRKALETTANFSDSDQYSSPTDLFLSSGSSSSLNNIVNEVFRTPGNRRMPEESSAISFDSFASFQVPDSTELMKHRHAMKVCNNMTCDATQTYVRTYLPPGLLFECE